MGRQTKMVIVLGFLILGIAIFIALFKTLLSMTLGQAILMALVGVGSYLLGKNN